MAKYYTNKCERERPRCKPLGIGKDCWTPKQIKMYKLNPEDIKPEKCLEDRQKKLAERWRACMFSKLANTYGASPYDEDQATREPRTPPTDAERADAEAKRDAAAKKAADQQPKAKPSAAEKRDNNEPKTKAEREAILKSRQDKEFKQWTPGTTIPTTNTDSPGPSKGETKEEREEERGDQGSRPPVPRKPDGDPEKFPDAEYGEVKIKTTIWEAIAKSKAICARQIQSENLIQELRSCFCDRTDCGEDEDEESKASSQGGATPKGDAAPVTPENVSTLPDRLQELAVTGSAYGTPIEVHYGMTHSLGNIIFMTPTVNYLQDEKPLLADIITAVARVTPYVIGPSISFALSLGESDPEMDVYRVYFDNVAVFNADTATTSLGYFIGDEAEKTSKLSLHHASTALPEEMRADGIGYRDLSFLFFRNIEVTTFKAFPVIRVLLRRKSAQTLVSQPVSGSVAHYIPISDARAIGVIESDGSFLSVSQSGSSVVSVPGALWRDTSESSGGAFISGRKVVENGVTVEALFNKGRTVKDGRNDLRVTYTADNSRTREAYAVVDDASIEFKESDGNVLASYTTDGAILCTTNATYNSEGITILSMFALTAGRLYEYKLRATGVFTESVFEETKHSVSLTHTIHSIVPTLAGLLFIGSDGITLRDWGTKEFRKLTSLGTPTSYRTDASYSHLLLGTSSGIYSFNTFSGVATKLSAVPVTGPQLYTGRVLFADSVHAFTVTNTPTSLGDIANDLVTRAVNSYSTVVPTSDFQVLGVKLSTLEEASELSRLLGYTAETRNEILNFDPNFASWETTDKTGDDSEVKLYSLTYFDIEGNTKETIKAGDITKLLLPLYLDSPSANYLSGIVQARLDSEKRLSKVRLAPRYLAVNPPNVFDVDLGHDLVSVAQAYGSRPAFAALEPLPITPTPSISSGFYPVYLDVSPVFAEDGSASTLDVSGYMGVVGDVRDVTLLAFGDDGLLGRGTVTRPMNIGMLISDNSVASPDVFSYQNPDNDYIIVNLPSTDRLYNFPRDTMNEAVNSTNLYRNILAIGREWIRFNSFTPTGAPSEYKLEGLRRGLFNTEMYVTHTPGEKVVHYDPGAFAPIVMTKARLTGQVGVSAFNNVDEDAPGVTARYRISKHTSYLPPSYAAKLIDPGAGTVSANQLFRLLLNPRFKLPVPIADAASVYGGIGVPYDRHLYAWLTPGTPVDAALFKEIVNNVTLRTDRSARVFRQLIYTTPTAYDLPSLAPMTVVWKVVTDSVITPYGHWAVATVDFTNLDYAVKQSIFTLEEP